MKTREKLPLSTVLNLKTCVEKSIESCYADISKYAATPYNKQHDYKKTIATLLEKVGQLEEQFVIFKEVIQEANQSKMFGQTNNFRIYTLSNLSCKKRVYELLRAKLKANKKKAYMSIGAVDAVLNDIQTQAAIIEKQLTAFNLRKQVTVDLIDELGLNPPSANNKSLRKFIQKYIVKS